MIWDVAGNFLSGKSYWWKLHILRVLSLGPSLFKKQDKPIRQHYLNYYDYYYFNFALGWSPSQGTAESCIPALCAEREPSVHVAESPDGTKKNKDIGNGTTIGKKRGFLALLDKRVHSVACRKLLPCR